MSELSAGVQILIAQMKENPDAFFGPLAYDQREGYLAPRFHGWRQAIEEELIGLDVQRLQVKRPLPATWFLSEDEKEALVDAYTLAKRQRFDAQVIYELNRPEGVPQQSYVYTTSGQEAMRISASGTLGVGTATTAASAIMGGLR